MPAKSKPHNNGIWTTARFTSFIKSALRSASNRWPPKYRTLQKARIERGLYECAGWETPPHNVRTTHRVKGKSKRNVYVDHIIPVIDPAIGFTSWDDFIKRLFVEEKDLQVLCADCHDRKTKQEKERRKNNG